MITILEALISTLPYLIAYKNISPYKFYIKDYIYMELSILITYFLLSFINENLSSIAVYFIPIFFIYKKTSKILLSIFLDIFICIIIIITDSCIGAISIYIFKIDITKFNYAIICLIILIGVYLVSKFIGILLYKYNILNKYKSKYAVFIYLSLIITFTMFYININWNNSNSPEYLNKANSLFFILYSIVLLFICLILLFIMKKDENFKIKQAQFESLYEYTNNLENLYMDMRKFRHDYINILSSISGFIEENNMIELEKYFSNTIYPLNKKMQSNNNKLVLLRNIKITEFKGLISSKLIKAQELGLNVDIDIMEEILSINMDIIDLIRSIGILLDNAIEASISTEEKDIALGIIKKESSIIIVIMNSYDGEINSIAKLFKEGYSTKGKNRGLGLSNLKEMINKNRNVLLDTSIEDGRFIQVLTINN